MSDLQNMFSVNFTALTNDRTYYARVYPTNPKGYAQAEIGTQVGSAIPVAGLDLSELPVGTVVMINESGHPVEFYVAKHDYESGLNGAGRSLLVRKECYAAMAWNTGGGVNYQASTIDAWLNSTYKSLLDEAVRGAVSETTIYTKTGATASATTISRSCFLLSSTEYGLTSGEGTALPLASTLKIAKLNGTANYHWTRSPASSSNITSVNASGASWTTGPKEAYPGVRPCFTLPATAKVSVDPNADGSYSLL